MKKLLIAAAFALAGQLAFAQATPATPAAPAAPQQQRMKDCNAQAKGMKGQPRKDFMKNCLSGQQAANQTAREERRAENQANREERREARQEARQTQQDKMKSCNAEAKGMKGAERRKFMSDCLKK